jgi:dihydroorotate dehydrogenase (NAD+) catalytic subunit
MVDISTKISGIKLKTPLMLASGILGTAGTSLKRIAVFGGASAIVTKSLGVEPRSGHKGPTIVKSIAGGLISAIGLANPGYEAFKEELDIAKEGGVPVIGSAYGFSFREYIEVAQALESYGASAVELNLSYPNVGKTGAFYGKHTELSYEVVKAVKESVNIPVFAKLTANVSDIVKVAKACEEAGVDAITAITSLEAMKIDVNTGRPVLGNKVGGLSGPCIKPIALRCVYAITKEVDVPVIGCGGITTGEDALEFIMAGAQACQIGTGILTRGITIFKKIAREMEEIMEKQGYRNLDEIRGIAH